MSPTLNPSYICFPERWLSFTPIQSFIFFILKMRTLKQHNYEPVINQIDQLTILIHKKHRIHNKSLIETLSKLKFEYDTHWKIKMMKSIEYGPNIKHKSYISWFPIETKYRTVHQPIAQERCVCVRARLFLIFINITTSSHVLEAVSLHRKAIQRISNKLYTEYCVCFSYIVLQYSPFCYYYSGAGINNMSENQETLQRCRRWLVNNLSVDNIECHLGEVLHTDSVQTIMVIFTIKTCFLVYVIRLKQVVWSM